MASTKLLIIDNHPLICEGIQHVLENCPNMKIVGTACDGKAGIEMARHYRPDVVLTEIRLPKLSGLDIVKTMAQEHPGMRVVILTHYINPAYICAAFRAGAAGFLSKAILPDELIQSIHTVVREGVVVPPYAARYVMQMLHQPRPTAQESEQTLSSREQEIVNLVSEGYTTAEIARFLHVSTKTVRNHLSNIYRKLGTKNLFFTAFYLASGAISTTYSEV